MAMMGDKLAARDLMAKLAVPTLTAVTLKSGDDFSSAASQIGYPLLVKAASGGGGKGMRVVANDGELQYAIESARREAAASFGDDRVYLERWLERCRHIELQILGDQHGQIVHCNTRSIQQGVPDGWSRRYHRWLTQRFVPVP